MGNAQQFDFFDVHVLRARRVTPSTVRVTFGGQALERFASGGGDQSFSLFLPHPGQDAPVLPGGPAWFAEWRALPEDVRAVMRSYTVRAQRARPAEVDVDFVLHEPAGPAAAWAAAAGPGDRAVLLGPTAPDNTSVSFRPPAEAEWVLLAGDATALPAIAAILEDLPAGLHARVFVEVPSGEDIQELAAGDVTWLVGGSGNGLVDAVRAARLPAGAPYAWVAGEAGAVRALRRHLVRDRGWDKSSVAFSGYWRRGASEEQLRAEAMAEAAGS